mgnify:CR=1
MKVGPVSVVRREVHDREVHLRRTGKAGSLPSPWAGTGSNGGTTAYLWVGDSPAEVSDRCGGCCLFCLSVCLL